MKCSKPGQFYGETNEKILLNGIILDDSQYTHDTVDWHFHENAYFTFLLQGGVTEKNKKETHKLAAGSLLFHNCQDPHVNSGATPSTRGFHVEITTDWFTGFDIPNNISAGSIHVADPRIKMLMYKIFRETKLAGDKSQLAIDVLLVNIFDLLSYHHTANDLKKPAWIGIIREALHATTENWQLSDLSKLANVHPVHLCREFPRHFNTTIGNYIRTIKIQQALSLLPDKNLSLTQISACCGFADQSHFIRTFKSFQQLTPLQYRKLLLK